ncbi:MAG: DUF3109 family protein [Flavobacteriaceae bacterium]|nr:DUF3109 family protein [Flavobacteriaceae bacterium]
MIQIGESIISEDIIEKDFVCNLNSCKGICCVEGDAGAPLMEDELAIIDKYYPIVKPFLRKEGIEAIENNGKYILNEDNDYEATMVNGKECAYVIFKDNGMTLCAFEDAYNKGLTTWKKPVSCHLYPIRVEHYKSFSAVNYDKWDICDDACSLGKELQVPVYKFVKEALVRKFGEVWYSELETVAEQMKK